MMLVVQVHVCGYPYLGRGGEQSKSHTSEKYAPVFKLVAIKLLDLKLKLLDL